MKKKTKKSKKTRGRPRVRAGCEYTRINIFVPVWLAEKLSSLFLKEGKPSRNKLIEWVLARFLGYNDKAYIKKCEDEARKEAKGKG